MKNRPYSAAGSVVPYVGKKKKKMLYRGIYTYTYSYAYSVTVVSELRWLLFELWAVDCVSRPSNGRPRKKLKCEGLRRTRPVFPGMLKKKKNRTRGVNNAYKGFPSYISTLRLTGCFKMAEPFPAPQKARSTHTTKLPFEVIAGPVVYCQITRFPPHVAQLFGH